jgi:hypothetical protein
MEHAVPAKRRHRVKPQTFSQLDVPLKCRAFVVRAEDNDLMLPRVRPDQFEGDL